ncbi:hypothetical protein C5167_047693 [Papaver somniferum]|uniref:F-box domain-containing protein n=1 Tax=Papaver somniferum TaxID=3469 RepID=A0A4Y7LK98_PAPSO|nr:F-box/kelch-repeat protein At3g23880-like [Papaver somniferum]RZC84908.1 hypothetical protein C5167_047693 [Papaver somniferum]
MDGNSEGNPNPNCLTQDLLIEILFWLPVVSLLRFKCVCKYWRSIIESSDFIHRHATFEKSTSKLGNFIFQYRPKHINNCDFKPYFFVLSSNRGSGDGGEEDYGQWSYKNLGMAPHLSDEDENERYAYYNPQANMVGSCRGIICIHDPHVKDIILWNPATKKFRCLPKSLPLLDKFDVFLVEFVLFGFDCETHDYKVLQISYFKNEVDIASKNKVQIYSLRSDSWRWCMDANLYSHASKPDCMNQGRYLNGSYYFVGKNFHTNETRDNFWSSTVGLSFNFSKESFRMIPVPHNTNRLDVIGGDQGKIIYITFVTNSTAEYINEAYEVYALNDYDYSCSVTNVENNEYSWSNLHKITITHRYGHGGPMAVTKNGMFGFLRGLYGGLVFINFLTEEMNDIEIVDASSEGLGQVLRGDVYKESLVSIDSSLPSNSNS